MAIVRHANERLVESTKESVELMPYDDLRAVAQQRLDAFIEIGLGAEMWPTQRRIARALSKPRARVVVPSCNASGKTFLAARLALAFYWAYPEDSIIITTSATESQLKDALWAEIRTAHPLARVPIPGTLPPSDMWLRDGPKHYVVGAVARGREGFQGRHAKHKLIIADEASSIDEETASGINGLLASGDARLLLTLNPTDTASWAHSQAADPKSEVIRIRAWDTPILARLTNEEIQERWPGVELEESRQPVLIDVPEGAQLTSPDWLDDMYHSGRGPGTPEWTTRVEALFWNESDTQLIIPDWIEKAHQVNPRPGRKTMGIDLAAYGTAENVIAYRKGNMLVKLEAYPSMRQDVFWGQIVRNRVRQFKPDTIIYDADGIGAGIRGSAEQAVFGTETKLHAFRGARKVNDTHKNARSAWWWRLRQQFEQENIRLEVTDTVLEEQLTSIGYDFLETGKIRVWSKEKMRSMKRPSPDRADAVMYAFAIDPPTPKVQLPNPRSEMAMWVRDLKELEGDDILNERNKYDPINPLTGSRQWW